MQLDGFPWVLVFLEACAEDGCGDEEEEGERHEYSVRDD